MASNYEKYKEYYKAYYKIHNSKTFQCDCGKTLQCISKKRHLNSKQHKNLIETYLCDCGMTVQCISKKKHLNSEKHKKLIESNTKYTPWDKKEYFRQYYQNNKNDYLNIKAKNKTFVCSCGETLKVVSKYCHLKSKNHLIATNNNLLIKQTTD